MRVYNYLIITMGLMILFTLAGIDTTASWISTNIGWTSPDAFSFTEFFTIITGIFILAAVGGIVIGFFTKSATESILLVPYATLLMFFVSDFIFVLTYLKGTYGVDWIFYIAVAIIFPLILGFAHSIISWWGGKA